MNWQTGDRWRAAAFIGVAFASVCLWTWILTGQFVCEIGSTTEPLQKTVEALDATASYAISWSVTIIGASAAVLLGLKSGMRLTPWSKSLMLICAFLFGQAAATGLYWKLGVANSWFNRCLNLIYEPSMARAFDAMLYLMVAGVLCALALVCVAAWTMDDRRQADGPG